MRSVGGLAAAVVALATFAAAAQGQPAPDFAGCVAEALTQSAALRPDGSFVINNIPTATGQIRR